MALISAQIVGGFVFLAVAGAIVPVAVAAVIAVLGLIAAGLAAVPVIARGDRVDRPVGAGSLEVV